MGKATRWFCCSLLGRKKEQSPSQSAAAPPRRKWSFVKPQRGNEHTDRDADQFSHAIAVATATAAAADVAVEAAQAAAAVVRLTGGGVGRCSATGARDSSARVSSDSCAQVSSDNCGTTKVRAAVTIQARFRGYLARRALRALKGLVKLQALVRGNIVRKQTADMLRIAQALLRAQARARAGRAPISDFSPHSSNMSSSQFHHDDPETPEKSEHAIRSMIAKHDCSPMLKRNGSSSIDRVNIDQDKAYSGRSRFDRQRWPSRKMGWTENERSDEILEVDNGKPHFVPKRLNLFQPSSHHGSTSDQYTHSFSTSKNSTTHQTVPSQSSCEVQSLSPLKFTQDVEESPFCTPDSSPQFYSSSSRGGSKGGPFTSYSDHPSYMACTESSRAKTRSVSAPKQRLQFDRSVSVKRNLVHSSSDSSSTNQRVLSNGTKAYPGSGCLDRFGMPVRGNAVGLHSGDWTRY